MLIVMLVAILDILVPGSPGNDLGRHLNFAQNRHYNFASTRRFDSRGVMSTDFDTGGELGVAVATTSHNDYQSD